MNDHRKMPEFPADVPHVANGEPPRAPRGAGAIEKDAIRLLARHRGKILRTCSLNSLPAGAAALFAEAVVGDGLFGFGVSGSSVFWAPNLLVLTIVILAWWGLTRNQIATASIVAAARHRPIERPPEALRDQAAQARYARGFNVGFIVISAVATLVMIGTGPSFMRPRASAVSLWLLAASLSAPAVAALLSIGLLLLFLTGVPPVVVDGVAPGAAIRRAVRAARLGGRKSLELGAVTIGVGGLSAICVGSVAAAINAIPSAIWARGGATPVVISGIATSGMLTIVSLLAVVIAAPWTLFYLDLTASERAPENGSALDALNVC
ncbi:MAG TPA: hypothetical protein VFJ58_12325 [Armatimonadota bacterium]|nr:hypothetical protein [Armatimonadota bacterium]